MAAEFSRGTIRTMLLRQPQRVRLLGGKLAALLTFAGVTLAVAETLTWVAARLLAPGSDVATAAWTSSAAVGAAAVDFGAVLLWVTGYAVLGTTLAVLLRSVPLALAVGIAWAGPIEHLVQDAWGPANRLFPGLLLEAFVAGGTPEVTAGRALVTVAAYTVTAAVLASVVFSRRDVTA
jgi:ABC-type transport system involved in multi-copper enzyme maturation permease subunit